MKMENEIYYKLIFNDDIEEYFEEYDKNKSNNLLLYLLGIEIIKETKNSKYIFEIDFMGADGKKIMKEIKIFLDDIEKREKGELV